MIVLVGEKEVSIVCLKAKLLQTRFIYDIQNVFINALNKFCLIVVRFI